MTIGLPRAETLTAPQAQVAVLVGSSTSYLRDQVRAATTFDVM